MNRDKTNVHIRKNAASSKSSHNDENKAHTPDEKTRVQMLRNDSTVENVVEEDIDCC